jgi:hypothetical protein
MKVRRDMRRTFGISKRLSQRSFNLTHENPRGKLNVKSRGLCYLLRSNDPIRLFAAISASPKVHKSALLVGFNPAART